MKKTIPKKEIGKFLLLWCAVMLVSAWILQWKVMQDVGIRSLGVLLVAFVLANLIGRRVASPIENISRQINEIKGQLIAHR